MLALVNIKEGVVGAILESTFEGQPRTQPLIYFWRGAAAGVGRFNTFSIPISLGGTILYRLILRVGGVI